MIRERIKLKKVIQKQIGFKKLKDEIQASNNPNYTVKSEIVFVAGLKYLKDHAFEFIETHFKDKYKLEGNINEGFKNVQYFLTVPGIFIYIYFT